VAPEVLLKQVRVARFPNPDTLFAGCPPVIT
jgi:hypothetical protein